MDSGPAGPARGPRIMALENMSPRRARAFRLTRYYANIYSLNIPEHHVRRTHSFPRYRHANFDWMDLCVMRK